MSPFLPGPGPLAPAPHSDAFAPAPTTYNQALTGALSFVGVAPTFVMQRALAGALSFVGAAVKFAMTRILTGAVFTPAGSVKRAAARTLTAAALTPSGVLVRVAARSLSGALSFTGAAIKHAATRTLSASLTPAGAAVKFAMTRSLTVAVFTPTGALTRGAVRALVGAVFRPTGAATTRAWARALAAAALSFIGGTNLYPDPNLYPGDDQFPYGGAILFQLNRVLPGVLRPAATVATSAHANALTFAAILQPQVVFLKTSARVFLSASFESGALIATRVAHNVFQSLFASLRAAGSMSTIVNPGHVDPGGGGWGVPMPDSFFMRYKPTLRKQKMRV